MVVPRTAATATVALSMLLRATIGPLRLVPAKFKPALWCRKVALGLLAMAIALLTEAGAALTASGSNDNVDTEPAGLAVTGLYSYARNPMYETLVLVVMPAISLALNSAWLLVLTPWLHCYLTLVVVPHEEALLLKLFRDAWDDYRMRTSKWWLLPF